MSALADPRLRDELFKMNPELVLDIHVMSNGCIGGACLFFLGNKFVPSSLLLVSSACI